VAPVVCAGVTISGFTINTAYNTTDLTFQEFHPVHTKNRRDERRPETWVLEANISTIVAAWSVITTGALPGHQSPVAWELSYRLIKLPLMVRIISVDPTCQSSWSRG